MIDLQIDENGDPVIVDGDFVADEADGQNLEHLLSQIPGEWGFDPLTGVGILRFAKQRQGMELAVSEVRRQLKADGWEKVRIEYGVDELMVDAVRV
jgi:hypothetical protein